MFDVALSSMSSEGFDVEIPDINDDWGIGVIVGPSGSGKSTVARQAFGEYIKTGFSWPVDKSVLDGFPDGLTSKQIVSTLNAVGFSSPPAWVRPYRVLSGGQQMRCDLARAMLDDVEIAVFDEFTSVVDRTVAKMASACVSKAIRSGKTPCRRFVAVACHYDIVEWLEPDWVLDMGTGVLTRGLVQRCEKLQLQVRPGGKEMWPMFARHHYLSHSLHKGSRCYTAYVDNEPVGICATLSALGFAGMRRIHRLVVLPDFQGVGVGGRLLNAVAGYEAKTHRVRIRTSHPGLIRSLVASSAWRTAAVSKGAITSSHHGMGRPVVGSDGRVTVSFEFRRGSPETQGTATGDGASKTDGTRQHETPRADGERVGSAHLHRNAIDDLHRPDNHAGGQSSLNEITVGQYEQRLGSLAGVNPDSAAYLGRPCAVFNGFDARGDGGRPRLTDSDCSHTPIILTPNTRQRKKPTNVLSLDLQTTCAA